MKLGALALNAAAVTLIALFASSAQAVAIPAGGQTIYEVNNPPGGYLSYYDENLIGVGDYIGFAPGKRELVSATFELSSDSAAAPDLTLTIYNASYNTIIGSSTTGSGWAGGNAHTAFSYTFLFNKLLVPDEIIYILSVDPLDLSGSDSLRIALTPPPASIGEDLSSGSAFSVLSGDTIRVDASSAFADDNGGIALTPVATFIAVPEPATAVLLGIGFISLGYARRRRK